MTHFILVFVFATLVACGGAQSGNTPATSLGGEQRQAATAASSPGSNEGTCPPTPDGLNQALANTRFLIVGEIHGTNEIPQVVGNVVCNLALEGPVTLALEIPVDEQERIAEFVSGDEGSLEALLAGAHWDDSGTTDGRSSQAMLDLIKAARDLRLQGREVEVQTFDIGAEADYKERERNMADNLRALRKQSSDSFTVVLVGNLHARRTKGTPFDPDAEPLAYLLSREFERILSLNVVFRGGSAWVCTAPEKCGPFELPEKSSNSAVMSVEETDPTLGYDAVLHIGRVSASSPASTR